MLCRSRNVYRYAGLFQLGFGHLRGSRSLPNQVVQFLFLLCSVNLHDVHISGSDGLVCLLCALRMRVEVTRHAVFLAPLLGNLFLGSVNAKTREVHAVGTHVGNATTFV